MDEPQELATPTTSTLATELRIAVGKLIRRTRAHADSTDLTWPQKIVIGLLDREGPATVTSLAQAEGVRPQSIGATVATLEAAGMIAGAPDPADGRRTLLSLTPVCRDLLHASRTAREDWLSNAIDTKLTHAQRNELACLIPLLERLVE